MASPLEGMPKIINHPAWGDTLYRTGGNIKLPEGLQVANSSVPLANVDEKNFRDVLAKILLSAPGAKASGVA